METAYVKTMRPSYFFSQWSAIRSISLLHAFSQFRSWFDVVAVAATAAADAIEPIATICS